MSNHDHDVLVVGGGLAGLTTARELRHAGHGVLILEGRNRIGGRAYTGQFAGTEVELGGMSVHWFQPHIFAEMTRYGVFHELPPEPGRWSYMSQGRMHDSTVADLLPRMDELFVRCFPDARETLPLPHQPLALPEAVARVGEYLFDEPLGVCLPDDAGAPFTQSAFVPGVLAVDLLIFLASRELDPGGVDNHDVIAGDGRNADIGSFRGARSRLEAFGARECHRARTDRGEPLRRQLLHGDRFLEARDGHAARGARGAHRR